MLDLIFSSPEVLITDLNKCTQTTLCSDHSLISFTVSKPTHLHRSTCTSHSISSTTSYLYKKADFNEMSSFIMDYDLENFYSSTDIELLWNSLKDLILQAISLYTPTVQTKRRRHPQWFTPIIHHQLHKIHSLRRKCKLHSTPHKTSCLLNAELQLQANIRSTRIAFESTLVSKFATCKDPSIFKYIKSFLKGPGLPTFLTYETTTVTSDVDKANAFNKFFHSTPVASHHLISPSQQSHSVPSPFPKKTFMRL